MLVGSGRETRPRPSGRDEKLSRKDIMKGLEGILGNKGTEFGGGENKRS